MTAPRASSSALVRALRALRNTDAVLARATREADLLQEVCRIIVKDCGHALAWIGYVDTHAPSMLRPVASFPRSVKNLPSLKVSRTDASRDSEPTAAAIRTGCPVVRADLAKTAARSAWRREAVRRGYAACLSLPIVSEGSLIGAVTMFSRRPNAFGKGEVRLLTDLIGELSYGIAALRLRRDRDDAVAALKNSEARYRSIFDSMEEGFALLEIIRDEKGLPCDTLFIAVNRAFATMNGLERNDLLGRLASEILPGLDSFWLGQCGEVALTGQPTRFERYSEHLGRHLAVHAYRPRPRQCAVLIMDISERRRMEGELARRAEELERAIAEKNDLLGIAAHDLRNPLMAIQGFCDLLIRRYHLKSRKPVLPFIEKMRANAQRMVGLVEDLLDISAIEAGRLVLQARPTDLDDLLRQTRDLQQAGAAAEKNIAITLETPTGLPHVIVDRNKIEQVITNLLANAIKFSSRDSVISITAEKTDGQIVCAVRDHGIGIPASDFDKLFTPFFRGRMQGTAGEKGYGLGLPIARKIALAHGGALTVESTEGEGSVFRLHLPINAESVVSPDERNAPAMAGQGQGKDRSAGLEIGAGETAAS